MPHPQPSDYQDAVQNPTHSFTDIHLKTSIIRTNSLGLPIVLSGGFALTYTASTARGKYAVRCFHKEIPSIESKYTHISRALTSLCSPYFVEFRFLRSGIIIKGATYPIVVMEWVEGDPLGVWLDKHHNNRTALL